MKEIPGWLKAVGVAVILAVFFAASQFLLWLDKAASAKVGLD